jgi:hypothetical protein
MPATESNRSAGRVLIGLLLLAPSVALASGDLRVLWWAIGGAAIYALVGGLLVVAAFRKEVRTGWLVLFAVAVVLAWHVYVDLPSAGPWMNVLFMVAMPLVWLLLLRKK